jgi:hypothetical protein
VQNVLARTIERLWPSDKPGTPTPLTNRCVPTREGTGSLLEHFRVRKRQLDQSKQKP